MIPSMPHGTGSRAELRVFDRLQAAFAGDESRDLTAFHSLNLTRHAYKRFGEIDFLIVGRPGVFVLEVKGGGISCRGGTWSATDGSGRVHRLRESPFRQAGSALHGLRERLQAGLGASDLSRFTLGYGVLFPDCPWRVQGAEWDQAMVADLGTSRNLEPWLDGLFAYWRRRDPCRRQGPDDRALAGLEHLLRPDFEVAVPLHVQVDELEGRVAALTEDQMRLLDVVDANPRVLCSGGAGTGKTLLAMELARRWAAAGRKVLLACRSPWLRRWLEAKLALPGVTLAVADTARTAARRQAVGHFDALIVDEGQDLLEATALVCLDGLLAGGFQAGRWCLFHDINNQAGLLGTPDPEALARLDAWAPARVPLTTNCRNTRQILEKIQRTLGADMGVRGSGDGPEVREHRAKTRRDGAAILAAEIEHLTERGGLSPGEISILSPHPFVDSTAALLPPDHLSQLVVLDEYALRSFPPDGIGFAEIANFKGMENAAIILVDLPAPARAVATSADHYVGMSRARAILSVISLG